MAEVISHDEILDRAHKRLQISVRIYLAAMGAISSAIIYTAFTHEWRYAAVAILVFSIAGGTLLSYRYVRRWRTEAQALVSQMNTDGLIFLISYVMFAFGMPHLLSWPFLTFAFTVLFIIMGAIQIGKGITLRKHLVHALHEHPERHKETK